MAGNITQFGVMQSSIPPVYVMRAIMERATNEGKCSSNRYLFKHLSNVFRIFLCKTCIIKKYFNWLSPVARINQPKKYFVRVILKYVNNQYHRPWLTHTTMVYNSYGLYQETTRFRKWDISLFYTLFDPLADTYCHSHRPPLALAMLKTWASQLHESQALDQHSNNCYGYW